MVSVLRRGSHHPSPGHGRIASWSERMGEVKYYSIWPDPFFADWNLRIADISTPECQTVKQPYKVGPGTSCNSYRWPKISR